MGSASREALRAAVDQLVATSGVTVATGEQLLTVGRAVDDSAQLRALLADPSGAPSEKKRLEQQRKGTMLPFAVIGMRPLGGAE